MVSGPETRNTILISFEKPDSNAKRYDEGSLRLHSKDDRETFLKRTVLNQNRDFHVKDNETFAFRLTSYDETSLRGG